jgi:glycosyltransferase involved in cell wall biosynthesis
VSRNMDRGVVFNGKFLSAAPTGVHRVAAELVRHVDQLLSPDIGSTWRIARPRDARRTLPLQNIQAQRRGLLTWQAWEQLELPVAARGRLLVNLCNAAPLINRGGVTLIHDAHVYLTPTSHSAAFEAWYRFALPRIAEAASMIVTVSNFSRERLIDFGVVRPEKIQVAPNGGDHLVRVQPDAAVILRLGLERRGYVLAQANAQAHKNIARLFDAVRGPGLGGMKLVLAGPDGPAAFAAVGAPPPDEVVFAGYVADRELRALYENAACLAFPSLTEGFGLPPLEAMSLDCPAVVAPCGALPETCGTGALYIDPDDSGAWSEALQAMAFENDRRQALVARGRAQVAGFRWIDSARRFMRLIETARAEQPAPRLADGQAAMRSS